MNNSHQVSQKDIAKALGVSVNTVSHALRDLPDISDNLKEKIKNKANELGYVPNGTAVKLKSGSSKTIALVYDSLINPFFSIMGVKIISLIKQRGYDTVIVPSPLANIISLDLYLDILELQVDGIISFLDFDEDVIKSKVFNSIPAVIVGRTSTSGVPTVNVDGIKGGKLVGEYFKSKGYEKVIFLCPQFVELFTKRYQGFLTVYKEDDVIKLYCAENNNYDHVLEVIQLEEIKGIFAFNDLIAVSFNNVIEEKNLDIEIIGFDNLHSIISYIKDISSVEYDFDHLAELSVSTIFELIKGVEIVNKNLSIDVSLHLKGGHHEK